MPLFTLTLEQFRAGYAQNAVSLRRRFEKVRDSGKNKTGFTLAELQHHADDSLRLSLLSDDDLRAHLDNVWANMTGAAIAGFAATADATDTRDLSDDRSYGCPACDMCAVDVDYPATRCEECSTVTTTEAR
jgi:hypothetical protein